MPGPSSALCDRLFRYSLVQRVGVVFPLVGSLALPFLILFTGKLFAWVGFFDTNITFRETIAQTPAWAWVIIIGAPLVLLWGGVANFLAYRSILITNAGLSALVWRWSWRTIAWTDVKQIDKVRDYNWSWRRHWIHIFVRSDSTSIEFNEAIECFDRLTHEVNEHVRQHDIPVYFTDHGMDTFFAERGQRSDQRRGGRAVPLDRL